MNLDKLFFLFIMLIIISVIFTGLISQLSINRNFYDIPNYRSSHDIPKPKGGGIPIVIILLLSISSLYLAEMLELDITMSMFVGISVVAFTGLLDDYKDLSASIRSVVYILSAIFSIYLIGGLTTVSVNNLEIDLGYFGFIISVLFLVWLTNLYNFMDGTDGFAAIQTICVGLFSGVLLFLSNDIPNAIILLCLVSSTIGFLYWNWYPAKIFMGDVGSCTLGFLFGLLAIYTEKAGSISISVWLILLAPFVGDATFTLLRRLIKGKEWYKAHNNHAFQRLHQLGCCHGRLAICLFIYNILIIWPLAYIAHSNKNIEFSMLMLSYIIIGAIWLMVNYKHHVVKVISS